MDPVTIGILGTAAAGAIGNFFSQKSAADRADAMNNETFQRLARLSVPNPEDLKLVLEKFVSQGTLDPRLEQAFEQHPSELKNITTDMSHKQAQNRALSELEKIGNEGGLRAEERLALEEAQQGARSSEKSSRDSILAEMARRGTVGSGQELAAKLVGQQGSADREHRAALETQAMAQNRALRAIEGAGSLAGKYRGQEFGEKARIADSENVINEFNTRGVRNVNSANTNIVNQAQAANLANKQDVANRNVGSGHQVQLNRQGLYQNQFNNEYLRSGGQNQVQGQQAQQALQQGQNQANLFSNLANAGIGAISAYGQQQQQNANTTSQRAHDDEIARRYGRQV